MIDIITVAGLLGYSAVKDLISLVDKNKRSWSQKKLVDHTEKVKVFAYDAAVCRLLDAYYSRSGRKTSLRRYRARVDEKVKETSVFTVADRVGMKVPSSRADCGLKMGQKVPLPRSVQDFAPTMLARLDQLGVKATNNPIFRLLEASLTGPNLSFAFGESSFSEYRFTAGLLEDELTDSLALNDGNITKILRDPSKTLPVRGALIPDIASLTSFSSRICAGGLGAVFAMARQEPYNDFVFPLQTRSANVADGRGLIAVLPKSFHEYAVSHSAEVGIQFSIYRELAEEIFGEKEAEGYGTRLCHDWYFDLPGLAYFRDHEGAFKNEVVGFGLNALTGNFEFAILFAVLDTWYWKAFSKTMKSMWEYSKVEMVSTKDPARIKQLLLEGNWATESVFHLLEGLIRLREIEPGRVELPDLGRDLLSYASE